MKQDRYPAFVLIWTGTWIYSSCVLCAQYCQCLWFAHSW